MKNAYPFFTGLFDKTSGLFRFESDNRVIDSVFKYTKHNSIEDYKREGHRVIILTNLKEHEFQALHINFSCHEPAIYGHDKNVGKYNQNHSS